MRALATEGAREQSATLAATHAATHAHALIIQHSKSSIGDLVGRGEREGEGGGGGGGMQSKQHSKSPVALSLCETNKPAVVPILKLPV